MITFFKNKCLYFSHFYSIPGVICWDLQKNKVFTLLNDPAYKYFFIVDVSYDGKLMAIAQNSIANVLHIVDIEKNEIIKTIHHNFAWCRFDKDFNKIFSLELDFNHCPIWRSPFCFDMATEEILTTFKGYIESFYPCYHPKKNSVYFADLPNHNLYNFSFDTLTFSEVTTEKSAPITCCRIASDANGYYYLSNHTLVYMDNNDKEVWRIDFNDKEDLKEWNFHNISLCENPNYIVLHLTKRKSRSLLIINRNDFSYKKIKQTGVIAEFIDNTLLLKEKINKFYTLNLETLEKKPLTVPPLIKEEWSQCCYKPTK